MIESIGNLNHDSAVHDLGTEEGGSKRMRAFIAKEFGIEVEQVELYTIIAHCHVDGRTGYAWATNLPDDELAIGMVMSAAEEFMTAKVMDQVVKDVAATIPDDISGL